MPRIISYLPLFFFFKMCQRQNQIEKKRVFNRICGSGTSGQGGLENMSSLCNTNEQRMKIRNRKKFRRWKKKSLMKRNGNFLYLQNKALNHLLSGDHCLGWMGLDRALAEAQSKKASPMGLCCCSTQFHFNQCLQLLLNKSKSTTTQSLKSVVR
mgnify:CR=1 FL=1